MKTKKKLSNVIVLADYSFNVGTALSLITAKAVGAKKVSNLFAAQVLLFEETKRLDVKKPVKKKIVKAIGKVTKKQLEEAKKERKANRNRQLESMANQAFMKSLKPSPELAAIVGAESQPRTRVVSKIWDYVKKHNLQNPKNKRNIMCDEKMQAFTKKKEVTMFELAGIVGRHLS